MSIAGKWRSVCGGEGRVRIRRCAGEGSRTRKRLRLGDDDIAQSRVGVLCAERRGWGELDRVFRAASSWAASTRAVSPCCPLVRSPKDAKASKLEQAYSLDLPTFASAGPLPQPSHAGETWLGSVHWCCCGGWGIGGLGGWGTAAAEAWMRRGRKAGCDWAGLNCICACGGARGGARGGTGTVGRLSRENMIREWMVERQDGSPELPHRPIHLGAPTSPQPKTSTNLGITDLPSFLALVVCAIFVPLPSGRLLHP